MATAEHLERNQWGWGKILVDGEYQWYPRISTIANVYKDKTNIEAWAKRNVAIGIATNPALAQQVLENKDDTKNLDMLTQEALVAAGATDAAETGTLLHELTEAIDRGESPDVPPHLKHVTDAYTAAVTASGLKPFMSEQFVVNDELRVCGSFDRAWLTPDGLVVIGDLKTGAHAHRYPHSVAMQIAMYANGTLYDPQTGVRTPMPEVSKEVGLLIHAPLKGGCKLIKLDLEEAYYWTVKAVESRAWHKTKITSDWS